ncbi:MAG TPA: GAF domain-containing protein [Actinomycetales bacterium]|nr:GAF domain-containing protein [Actinomycetales bacterium]
MVAISSDLDLHSVLDRTVVSACRITGARYGALGVVGDAGGLVDFVTCGLTDEEHAAIGDLPLGQGILGLLVRHPHPLRPERLQSHPDSFGFPSSHPRTESFLGVPARIRGTVFGNLDLTEKSGGAVCSEKDERLLVALASAAGVVIENARAFAQSELRRQWLEASAQIVDSLQPPVRVDVAMARIAAGARRVTRGTAASVVQDGGHGPRVSAADGDVQGLLPGLVTSLAEHLSRVEHDTGLLVVPRAQLGSAVMVPLRARLAAGGVLLVVLDAGLPALAGEEATLLASFADQAALALDRAQAMSEREALMLVADRDRIARDLHDLVIKRLFATGLHLRGARRMAVSDEVRDRLDRAVEDLDVTIKNIRSTIFELGPARDLSLRADVRKVVKEYVPVLGFAPLVRTSGPVDTAFPTRSAPICSPSSARPCRTWRGTRVRTPPPSRSRQPGTTSRCGSPTTAPAPRATGTRAACARCGCAPPSMAEPCGSSRRSRTARGWSGQVSKAGLTSGSGSAAPGWSGPRSCRPPTSRRRGSGRGRPCWLRPGCARR